MASSQVGNFIPQMCEPRSRLCRGYLLCDRVLIRFPCRFGDMSQNGQCGGIIISDPIGRWNLQTTSAMRYEIGKFLYRLQSTTLAIGCRIIIPQIHPGWSLIRRISIPKCGGRQNGGFPPKPSPRHIKRHADGIPRETRRPPLCDFHLIHIVRKLRPIRRQTPSTVVNPDNGFPWFLRLHSQAVGFR
jgi:hypothetical protein